VGHFKAVKLVEVTCQLTLGLLKPIMIQLRHYSPKNGSPKLVHFVLFWGV
jgi:hypothetical protein